eukprot:CAMPEP_0204862566 /NCGR_PEP_ID=MMETSP1348-20121228/2634_1 /ASSEMBLY_ACC=CAM_ASM_000700 /TAXON_ID=215587 /ORGANISM="Aplanochytrium stocchinoi, Strain GSBS06" /LENGTH=401 /DNA_ID=CAMNT_0052012587 /DNA_START=46 /DNA_END=1252 /DNA_ORIENTATION=-
MTNTQLMCSLLGIVLLLNVVTFTLATSCTVGVTNGNCKDVSFCAGVPISGYCAGPTEIQCCVFEQEALASTEFLPNIPSTSASLGSCKTRYQEYTGVCIPVSDCTGATFNGLCPGSSSIKCCVTETETVKDITDVIGTSLSQAEFEQQFEGISSTRAAALRPYFNFGIAEILVDAATEQIQCYRLAGFIAQIGYESAGLLYFEELADGTAYEGRESLGNIHPGDGPRFKGRGPIQLTGRSNYRAAGNRLGIDLEADPERVCMPSMGFLTTVDYWMSRNLNTWASTNSETDFEELTLRINGGYNGLVGRKARWEAAKTSLDCASKSTAPITATPPINPTSDGVLGGAGADVVIGIGAGAVALFAAFAFVILGNDGKTEDNNKGKGTLSMDPFSLILKAEKGG